MKNWQTSLQQKVISYIRNIIRRLDDSEKSQNAKTLLTEFINDNIILSPQFPRWLSVFDGNDWSVFCTSLYPGNFSL